MKVGVIDLGINNLSSVKRAFSAPLNQEDSLNVITGGEGIERPDLIILPGLGNFRAGMSSLADKNLIGKLREWNEAGSKIIGICLGMQLLGKTSEESPGVQGLSLIPAVVEKLTSEIERVPHVGWAASKSKFPQNRFNSLSSNGDFYFVQMKEIFFARQFLERMNSYLGSFLSASSACSFIQKRVAVKVKH